MNIKIISQSDVKKMIEERERILWKEIDKLRAEILGLNEKLVCLKVEMRK